MTSDLNKDGDVSEGSVQEWIPNADFPNQIEPRLNEEQGKKFQGDYLEFKKKAALFDMIIGNMDINVMMMNLKRKV